ncbi:hypothetical protein H0H92_009017 [Tricholoma furcatifolium]|nr:hypothetical protein H0H92_009017 [Tricholoma furcatifolium]
MGNYGVYVTLKNKTKESLTFNWKSANTGKWVDVPNYIAASKDASFTLEDTAWFSGTEGAFSYKIDGARTEVSTYQTDPYAHDNVVVITESPLPAALYTLSFRASVNDDKHYKDNRVEPDGHPVYIEYTLDYERKKHYKFQLLKITATSDLPVRNSRDRTIVGPHTLWDPSTSNKDGNVGSYEPNAFAYDFKSRIPDTGFVSVNLQPMDAELSGAEVILIGSVNNKEVFKSDYFFFKGPYQAVTVTAHLITPLTSDHPISFNDDIDWGVRLRLSDEKLERYGDGVTRLELYWIAKDRHRAFKDYIPVSFLRLVLKGDQVKATAAPAGPGQRLATFTPWYQQQTNMVFDGYYKHYDVFNGAPHFGVWYWGGTFDLTRYTAGQGGTNPIVNCFDQAAMVELSCSLYVRDTSWLCLEPFGYIKTTHLVGVKDYYNNFLPVNNPFFGNNVDRANVDPNANDRYGFKCHAFNGHTLQWTNESNDGIYDACGGPHLGTQTIIEYCNNVPNVDPVDAAIDRTTGLYQTDPRRCFGPGDYHSVVKAVGVEAVDGQPMFAQRRDNPLKQLEADTRLVSTVCNHRISPLAYVNWPRLPTWLNATLGDTWEVQYEHVSVGTNVARAFFEISESTARNAPISIDVSVFSAVTEDGTLDVARSAAAAKERTGDILMSTQRSDSWTSGNLPGVGGYLKYADHIEVGRIVLVSGNAVMDIRGLSSTEALLPHALKLFNQTNSSHPVPPVPVLRRNATLIHGSGAALTLSQGGTIAVTGIHTRFCVAFTVNRKVSTAKGGCDGTGVLFDRYAVKDEDEDKEADGSEVAFFFIAHEVGRHRVRVSVADAETMLSTFSEFEVEVTAA